MTLDLAVVRDEDRVLIGLFENKDIEKAQQKARENNAHTYLLGERKLIKNQIGKEVEFNYRWKFERDD